MAVQINYLWISPDKSDSFTGIYLRTTESTKLGPTKADYISESINNEIRISTTTGHHILTV